MKDIAIIKKQLIEELETLRKQIDKQKKAEIKRKKSEEAIREKVEEAASISQMILEKISEGVAIIDVDGKVVKENKALTKMFDCNTLIGKPITDFIVEEEIPRAFSALDRMKKLFTTGEHILDFEFTAITKHGKRFSIIVNSTPLKDKEGKITGFIGVLRDITERKKVEEELRHTKEYLETLNDTIADVIFRVSFPERIVEYVNRAVEKVFGYAPEECIGKNTANFYASEDGYLDIGKKILKAIEQGQEVVHAEQLLKRKNGEIFPGELTVTFLKENGKITTHLGVLKDITERKKAEKALQESESKFRSLFAMSPLVIAVTDVETGRLIDVNEKFCEAAKLHKNEICGHTTTELGFYSQNDRERFLKELLTKGEVKGLEMDFRVKDGSIVNSLMFSKLVQIHGKTLILTMFQDISERKRVEEALKQSEEKYRAIVEDQTELICRFLPGGQLTFVNNAYCRYFGREQGNLVGSSFLPLIPEEDHQVVYQMQALITKENPVVTHEHRVTQKDGQIRWQQWTNRGIFDEKGHLIEFQAVGRDITKRKRAEEALTLHSLRTQALLDLHMIANESRGQIMDFVLEAALKATQSIFSFIGLIDETESFMTIHTWSKDTMEQCSLGDKPIHYPISEAGVWGDCVRQRKPIIINDYEAPLPTKKGYPEGHVPIQSLLSIPVFDGGRIVAVAAVANKEEDYTEDDSNALIALLNKMWEIIRRKQVEEAMQEREKKLHSIFRAAPVGIGMVINRVIQEANDTLCQMTGYSRQELLGQNARILYPTEEDFVYVGSEKYRQIAERGNGTVETRWRRKDGSVINIILSSVAMDVTDLSKGVTFTALDVTERKRAEEALRYSEGRYRALVENINLGITLIDSDYRIIMTNAAHGKMFKKPAHEFIGKECFKEFEKSSTVCMHCPGTRAMATGHPEEAETEGIRDDGSRIPVRIVAYPNFDMDGNIKGFIEVVEDITERKRFEESLKQLMHKHQLILDAAGEGIIGLDLEGNVTFANPFAVKTTGYEIEELSGQNLHEILHYKKLDGKPYPYEECPSYETLKTGIFRNIRDEVFFRKDGTSFPVRYTSTPIIEENEIKGAVVTFRDITDRKKLEEQFLQAQKMEAVGHLAGGIAHDFNNILTAIIGYGNLLQMKIKENDPLRSYINQILLSSEKAANLTHGLLAFSRKQIINPKPVNLNDIVKNVEKLLLRLIGEDIELQTILGDDDVIIMADSGQIEQVLMNLATNARDAMPEGGTLTISTEIVELDSEYIRTSGYGKPGKYALVSITDTGKGIEEKTKELIFEPFFTTKERGRGTGLGLAVAYGIVKQHNGNIEVYSELSKGTTFRIYIPIIEAEVEEIKPKITITPTGGTETVLIAEDSIDVRNFTKMVLEQFGYKVIEAVNGEDAIERFMENKDKIDFLLLDVIMPKKNGKEVYEAIKKVRPDIKALFLSGYAEDIIHKKGILEKGLTLILKPISPQELLKKIREVLNKNGEQ